MTNHNNPTAQSPLLSTRPEDELVCHRPALTFNADEFQHFLADCDWTDDQKREFIKALWQIIVGFVDVRFGIHPLQQIAKTLEVDSPAMLALENNSDIEETSDAAFPVREVAQGMDS